MREATLIVGRAFGTAFHQCHASVVVSAGVARSEALRRYAAVARGIAELERALAGGTVALHATVLRYTTSISHERRRVTNSTGTLCRAPHDAALIVRGAFSGAGHQVDAAIVLRTRGALRHASSHHTVVAGLVADGDIAAGPAHDARAVAVLSQTSGGPHERQPVVDPVGVLLDAILHTAVVAGGAGQCADYEANAFAVGCACVAIGIAGRIHAFIAGRIARHEVARGSSVTSGSCRASRTRCAAGRTRCAACPRVSAVSPDDRTTRAAGASSAVDTPGPPIRCGFVGLKGLTAAPTKSHGHDEGQQDDRFLFHVTTSGKRVQERHTTVACHVRSPNRRPERDRLFTILCRRDEASSREPTA